MTKKPTRSQRHIPLLSKDSVRPPPTLPDAQAVLDMGFRLTSQETDVIYMAMAIHSASKQPQLTWKATPATPSWLVLRPHHVARPAPR